MLRGIGFIVINYAIINGSYVNNSQGHHVSELFAFLCDEKI